MHVEVRGAGGARILLVMGLGMPGEMWSAVAPLLAARHTVATFDHRGVGHTVGPARATMAELAADTLGVLDGLGWSDAHVVGVSMGGMVAQHVALDHPERVTTLTLIATHAGGPFAAIPPAAAIPGLLRRDRARRLELLLHPPALRPAMAARSRRSADLLAPPATVRRHLRAVLGHDTRARLGAIRAPTLVVKPALDVLVRPSHSDRLAAGIPGARLEVRPAAGHGIVAHDADALASAILAHVG